MALASHLRTPPWAAVATLVVGIALSLLLALRQARGNDELIETQLQAHGGRIVQQLFDRLHIYEYGLRATRGVAVLAGEDSINQALFRRYIETRDIDREFPGARGFGVIRRVAPDAIDAYVERQRRQTPDFAVRTLEPHAEDNYIIELIEPVDRNRAARGLDIGSESKRRAAAEQALASGNATITAPITLVQAADKESRSFLVLLPIYREGLAIDTPAQRRAAAWGWAYVPIVIDEVLKAFDFDELDFALELEDVTGAVPEPFYLSAALAGGDNDQIGRAHV